MRKIDWKSVGQKVSNTAKEVGTVAGVVLLTAVTAPIVIAASMAETSENRHIDYSDVVKTILDSSMYNSDKAEAISVLKRDGDYNYYKSIISIVESSMYNSDKLDAIEKLSE